MSETIDSTGNEVLSSATVYLSADVQAGGALMLATLADLGSGFPVNIRTDRRVKEIISKGRVPNLKATQFLTTAQVK